MIKHYFSALLIGVAIFSLSSCKRIAGSGPVQTEQRQVNNFTKVSLDMDAALVIRQDSIFKVEVAAQSNLLPVILTQVNGTTLTVKHRNNTIIQSGEITVYISMPTVSALSVSGSGSILTQNQINTASVSLDVSGSGKITLTGLRADNIDCNISGSGDISIVEGTAHNMSTQISGSGKIDCTNLFCTNVYTTTTGSGTHRVYAESYLSAKISGSGNVYYRGNPTINADISGSGKLIKQ